MFWVSLIIFIIISFPIMLLMVSTTNSKPSEDDALEDILQELDDEGSDLEDIEDLEDLEDCEEKDEIQEVLYDDLDDEINLYICNRLGIQVGQDFFISRDGVDIAERDGYERYEIKGMRFCSLQLRDIGYFEGYAKAETDNKYDEFAISVYREDCKHIGYLPASNSVLHQYIVENGGYVHCVGVVQARSNRGGYFGKVIVERDKAKVKERNKPFDAYKYYVYNENELNELFKRLQM